MTKAQKATQKAIATIRDAGLSQSQLAEMIGASLDTVKAWTRKRNPNPISTKFQHQIMTATGAEIKNDGSVVEAWRDFVDEKKLILSPTHKPYTAESFRRFVESGNPKKNRLLRHEVCIEGAKQGVELLLRAAVNGEAGTGRQTKFVSVLDDFDEWLCDASRRFKLERPLSALVNSLPKDKRFYRVVLPTQ